MAKRLEVIFPRVRDQLPNQREMTTYYGEIYPRKVIMAEATSGRGQQYVDDPDEAYDLMESGELWEELASFAPTHHALLRWLLDGGDEPDWKEVHDLPLLELVNNLTGWEDFMAAVERDSGEFPIDDHVRSLCRDVMWGLFARGESGISPMDSWTALGQI